MSYEVSYAINTSELFIITFIYLLIAFIIILPPSELITAGFSIENIFSHFLAESEEISFIKYHIKRISIKYLVHSFLPLGYIFVLLYYSDWSLGIINACVFLFTRSPIILRLILYTCLCIPIVTSCIVFRWHMNDYYLHPIVQQLRLFIQTNNQEQQTWHTVESSINTEFRRYDKFSCGSPTSNVRCYVLDSWILKCSIYHVNIAQQSNVRVELIDAHDVHLQEETNEGASLSTQYLNISIISNDTRVKPFYIR